MTGPHPITSRQLEVLRFIVGYQAAHGGVSPTFAEIARGVGVRSKSSVMQVLDGLQEGGWIVRLRARPQSIQVLAPVAIPRAPDGAPLHVVPLPALRPAERNSPHA